MRNGRAHRRLGKASTGQKFNDLSLNKKPPDQITALLLRGNARKLPLTDKGWRGSRRAEAGGTFKSEHVQICRLCQNSASGGGCAAYCEVMGRYFKSIDFGASTSPPLITVIASSERSSCASSLRASETPAEMSAAALSPRCQRLFCRERSHVRKNVRRESAQTRTATMRTEPSVAYPVRLWPS